MKNSKFRLFISIALIALLVFSSAAIAFAGKPAPQFNVTSVDVKPTYLTVDFNWDRIPVYSYTISVGQYTKNEFGVYSYTGRNLGAYSENLSKRTSSYLGSVYISFEDYLPYLEIPASGSYCSLKFSLYDKKGNKMYVIGSQYYLIP